MEGHDGDLALRTHRRRQQIPSSFNQWKGFTLSVAASGASRSLKDSFVARRGGGGGPFLVVAVSELGFSRPKP